MNIIVVVQARTGSTRLPGKIALDLLGKPVLTRQIERIKASLTPKQIVVATTTDSADDLVQDICEREGILSFRGNPLDLLDRHYKAGLHYGAELIVKIPSDCPLIDPSVIDKVIGFYLENRDKYDFVSNLHPPTYPDGNDVEIMPMEILETAWKEAKSDFEREHTTPFIWDNPERFGIGNFTWEKGMDYSMTHRFTLDYYEDYEFIKSVYSELYPVNSLFSLEEILKLLEKKPELMTINAKYAGVNWYRNHLDSLKTITPEQTRFL